MEKYTVRATIDTERLREQGRRDWMRQHLNHKAYDEIMKILGDGQRHLLRVSYSERREGFDSPVFAGFPDQTVCFLELEVGTVHIHQYEMHVHDYSAEPMWKVTRSAIDELKYRIRSRWRKLWSRK